MLLMTYTAVSLDMKGCFLMAVAVKNLREKIISHLGFVASLTTPLKKGAESNESSTNRQAKDDTIGFIIDLSWRCEE